MVTKKSILDMEIPFIDMAKIRQDIQNIVSQDYPEPQKSILIRKVFDKYRNENNQNQELMQKEKTNSREETN